MSVPFSKEREAGGTTIPQDHAVPPSLSKVPLGGIGAGQVGGEGQKTVVPQLQGCLGSGNLAAKPDSQGSGAGLWEAVPKPSSQPQAFKCCPCWVVGAGRAKPGSGKLSLIQLLTPQALNALCAAKLDSICGDLRARVGGAVPGPTSMGPQL